MKTNQLKIIPGPYRVCEEKHNDGSLVIRSSPKGGGDVPGDLVVALVVGGGPEEHERNTANLLASAPDMLAAIIEYIEASTCNIPADRVQKAWERLCAITNKP